MRFLSIVRAAERTAPPSQNEMEQVGKLIEEGMKAGWLLVAEGLLPSSVGVRLRKSHGNVTVTDGPFTEAKEVVGGFSIFEAKSMAHAIELARGFLVAGGDGECEIRQLYDEPEPSTAGAGSDTAAARPGP